MKKLLLASLLVLGFYGVSKAENVALGVTHAYAVSSGVVFNRATLMRIECSSIPSNSVFNANWIQLFDTTTIAGEPDGVDIAAFRGSTANIATPPISLTSSVTLSGLDGFGNGGVSRVYFPFGISFSRDGYLFFGGAPIAGWQGCALYWKKDDW